MRRVSVVAFAAKSWPWRHEFGVYVRCPAAGYTIETPGGACQIDVTDQANEGQFIIFPR
jgi:hypothetical protein